jgi:hypothetical protein
LHISQTLKAVAAASHYGQTSTKTSAAHLNPPPRAIPRSLSVVTHNLLHLPSHTQTYCV